jgi:hypothetical protein
VSPYAGGFGAAAPSGYAYQASSPYMAANISPGVQYVASNPATVATGYGVRPF